MTRASSVGAILTNPHGGQLGIHGRTLLCAAKGEIAEREETEYICEGCVHAIVVGGVVVTNIVQFRD